MKALVVEPRHRNEVVGIDAEYVFADVMQVESRWDRSVRPLVGETMRQDSPRPDCEPAVAIDASSEPRQAIVRVRFTDESEETVNRSAATVVAVDESVRLALCPPVAATRPLGDRRRLAAATLAESYRSNSW